MSTRWFRVVVTVMAGLALGACGSAQDGPPQVQVGTGQFDFVTIAPGSAVEIVCGPQGGQHIWISLRARNLEPSAVSLRMVLRYADTAQIICGQQLEGVALSPADGWSALTGVACFVTDPVNVRNRAVILSGKVVDGRGRSAEAEIGFVPFGPSRSCQLGGGDDGGVADGGVLDGGVLDGGAVDGGVLDGGV